jgi:hypothetical protein
LAQPGVHARNVLHAPGLRKIAPPSPGPPPPPPPPPRLYILPTGVNAARSCARAGDGGCDIPEGGGDQGAAREARAARGRLGAGPVFLSHTHKHRDQCFTFFFCCRCLHGGDVLAAIRMRISMAGVRDSSGMHPNFQRVRLLTTRHSRLDTFSERRLTHRSSEILLQLKHTRNAVVFVVHPFLTRARQYAAPALAPQRATSSRASRRQPRPASGTPRRHRTHPSHFE